MARKHLGHDTDEFLASEGLKRSDIGCWLLHTGGPKVLEAMQDALDLHDGELAVSWDCLRKPAISLRHRFFRCSRRPWSGAVRPQGRGACSRRWARPSAPSCFS